MGHKGGLIFQLVRYISQIPSNSSFQNDDFLQLVDSLKLPSQIRNPTTDGDRTEWAMCCFGALNGGYILDSDV